MYDKNFYEEIREDFFNTNNLKDINYFNKNDNMEQPTQKKYKIRCNVCGKYFLEEKVSRKYKCFLCKLKEKEFLNEENF